MLAAAFIFISFGYLNGNLLVTLGLQSRMLWISVVALAANLCGNLILVPTVGFMGAAWMTMITEVIVCVWSLTLILRTLGMGLPKPGRIGRTVAAAALLTALLEVLSAANASLVVLILATCVGYPALLFVLRACGRDDVEALLRRTVPA